MCASSNLSRFTFRRGLKLPDDTFLKPDASFIRQAQIARTPPDGYFEGAPALAIEVASDSNTAAQLDLKMELYFAHGAEGSLGGLPPDPSGSGAFSGRL